MPGGRGSLVIRPEVMSALSGDDPLCGNPFNVRMMSNATPKAAAARKTVGVMLPIVLALFVVVNVAQAPTVVAAGIQQRATPAAQRTPPSAQQPTSAKPAGNKRNSPLPIKSIGFTLEAFDPATNKAGDMMFTKLPLFQDKIWADFGTQDPRSPNDPSKRNVQPTFILPLGTKVLSLVDGEVVFVEKLYSNDYTIMVAYDARSTYRYETEHVDNPVVKVGDKVRAGQVIAEVSKHDSQHHPGFGILEIGILHPEGPQAVYHLCPFQYLDASIKAATFEKINALYVAWNAYLGKTVYMPERNAVPGCATLEPVAG